MRCSNDPLRVCFRGTRERLQPEVNKSHYSRIPLRLEVTIVGLGVLVRPKGRIGNLQILHGYLSQSCATIGGNATRWESMDLHHVRILLLDHLGQATVHLAALIAEIQAVRYQLISVAMVDEALKTLATQRIDVVIIALTPDDNELAWMQTIRLKDPCCPIVVYTNVNDEPRALYALHMGAHDYVLMHDLTPSVFQRTIRYVRAIVAKDVAEQQVQTLTKALAIAMSTTPTHDAPIHER